jgi:hypothetical protein
MSSNGDDKVGWDAVGRDFRLKMQENQRRATNLIQRLRELPSGGVHSSARIRVWQALRDLDVLPNDHVFYVIAWELAGIASERHGHLYSALYEPKFRAIYGAGGIDYDDLEALENWTDDSGELERLSTELNEQEDRLREEVYREFGEIEMANMWANDRPMFEARWERGQEMAHPGLKRRLEQLARGEITPGNLFSREH